MHKIIYFFKYLINNNTDSARSSFSISHFGDSEPKDGLLRVIRPETEFRCLAVSYVEHKKAENCRRYKKDERKQNKLRIIVLVA